MDKETKDLYIFGYGLSLIIPFLVFFHSLSLGVKWWSVLALILGFSLVLWIITKISEISAKINLWILIVQLGVLGFVLKGHPSVLPVLFLMIAIAMLITTVVNVSKLSPIYGVWMKVAHFIGETIQKIVLGLMFYVVFAPIGIFFRLIKKDHLNRQLDPNQESYWKVRDKVKLNKKRYTQQF